MKSILPKCFYFLFFFVFLFHQYTSQVSAVTVKSAAPPVSVSAKVGEFYLSVSGYIAPFASVVLLGYDTVLRSAVADTNGFFYISQVLIQRGLSSFCFDAVDAQRYGESYSCISIPPATADVTVNNIFLPPTLGLVKTDVTAGSEAIARGYTMRNGKVTLHMSDGRTFTITANADGYYEVHISVPKAGTYELFADAVYNGNSSLKPQKKVVLNVLSLGQQIGNTFLELLQKLWKFLTGSPWTIILIILPIIILILILLRKLKPEWFTFIDRGVDVFVSHLPFVQRRLHHWWFVGY